VEWVCVWLVRRCSSSKVTEPNPLGGLDPIYKSEGCLYLLGVRRKGAFVDSGNIFCQWYGLFL
jgi:hypothetical protein